MAIYATDWDEKYESLVDRIRIDAQDYLELSPTGQIFHETFRQRFRTARDQVLPPAVPEPKNAQHAWRKPAGRENILQSSDS